VTAWRTLVYLAGQAIHTQPVLVELAHSLVVPTAPALFAPQVPRANCPRQFWCGMTLLVPFVITSGALVLLTVQRANCPPVQVQRDEALVRRISVAKCAFVRERNARRDPFQDPSADSVPGASVLVLIQRLRRRMEDLRFCRCY
jgi:hypothetical protein